MKLFMEPDQDPPDGDEHRRAKFGARGVRWNPFLERFGVLMDQGPHDPRIRIRREHLRKHDGAGASWKRMFLSYPTRMSFRAYLKGGFFVNDIVNCRYDSKVKAENMRFLTEADRGCCYNHSHIGHQSERTNFRYMFGTGNMRPFASYLRNVCAQGYSERLLNIRAVTRDLFPKSLRHCSPCTRAA